jgi:hypothetical protein
MRLLIIIFLLGTELIGTSFCPNKECSDFMKNFLHHNNSLPANEPGKTLNIQYQTKIVYSSAVESPPLNQHTDIVLRAPYFILTSPTISIYKDSFDYFMIVHASKKVIWTKPNNAFVTNENFWKQTFSLQDSFLSMAKDIQCEEESTEKDGTVKELKIDVSQHYVESSKVRSISIKIRTKDLFMLESTIHYGKESPIEEVTNSFKDYSYNTTTQFPERIKTMILTNQNELKKSFSEYSLLDMRKRKTKKN